jgi:hypothetical protein
LRGMTNKNVIASPPDWEKLYVPHKGKNGVPGQDYLHRLDAKALVLMVSRRWGKSRFALMAMLQCYYESLSVPVPTHLVPPFHAWCVVPAMPQARQSWNEMLTLIPEGWIAEGGIHHQEMMIYLKGAPGRDYGLIEVKSAFDPDNLQTAGLDFLWIQEAQDIANRAFEKVLPAINSPERMGKAIFEGIPPLYADHWFNRGYEAAANGSMNGWFPFRATFYDNPLLRDSDIEEIENQREVMSIAAWERMYMAKFSENAGYFSNVNSCIAGDVLPKPLPGVRYVAGIDLGRKHDATVVHIFDAHERALVHHRTFDQGESWVIQREVIGRLAKEWGLTRVVVDASSLGGDIFTEELMNMGISVEPFQITRSSRDGLLETVVVALERETVHFPPIATLLRQLRAFQYRRLPGGFIKVEAPPGEHDDEVFAFALGLAACDPPQEVMAGRKLQSKRYLPTADETQYGLTQGQGVRMMKNRQTDKMRQRLEKNSVI